MNTEHSSSALYGELLVLAGNDLNVPDILMYEESSVTNPPFLFFFCPA
jgi:hypothetical protein